MFYTTWHENQLLSRRWAGGRCRADGCFRRLGVDPETIEACLISHFHGDAVYSRRNLEQRLPTPTTVNADESRAFVETYSDPRYRVYLCHD